MSADIEIPITFSPIPMVVDSSDLELLKQGTDETSLQYKMDESVKMYLKKKLQDIEKQQTEFE